MMQVRKQIRISNTQGIGIGIAILFVGMILLGMRYNFGIVEYVQFALDGLRAGAIYALVALGFVTVYRVTGVINFAQGAFIMLGPLITISIYEQKWFPFDGLNLAVGALVAVLITMIVGIVIERLTLYPAELTHPP